MMNFGSFVSDFLQKSVKLEERAVYLSSKVIEEMIRQNKKWGVQNHPSVSAKSQIRMEQFPENVCKDLEIPTETRAKEICETMFSSGDPNWAAILQEEVSEAVCAKTEQKRREELVQVAAVALSWVDCLDRNSR